MKLWRVSTLMVVVVVSCLALKSVADTPRIDPLRNVELQSLPAGVCGVVVGPDDTVWCEAAVDGDVPVASGRERIKQQLREQWGRPMPCLTGAKPVLFQKSGRIWFACKWEEKEVSGEALLAFNGKDFVEPAEPVSLAGIDREDWEEGPTGQNVELGGTAYFVTKEGITRFEAGKFVVEPLLTPARPVVVQHLMVTSDGKGLLALGVDRAGKQAYLWRYGAGKWAATELPAKLWTLSMRVLPLGSDHLLFFNNTENEEQQVLGPAAVSALEEDPRVDGWIKQLGENEFAKRQAAADELLACGPLLLGKLQTALAAATDAEIKARLGDIMKQYEQAQASTRLGPYTLKGIWGAQGDAQGRVYITAAGVTENGRGLGDGLLIGDGKTWDFLAGDTVLDGIPTPRPNGEASFSAQVCGEEVWIQDSRKDRPNGLRRLDLVKRTLEAPIPRGDLGWILGRQKTGTVFAGLHEGVGDSVEVVAYRPGRPSERRTIPVTTRELWGPVCAEDGKVWAYDDGKKELVCFDGTAWKTRAKIPGTIGRFHVGTGDTVIVFTRQVDDPWPAAMPGGGVVFPPAQAPAMPGGGAVIPVAEAIPGAVLLVTPKELFTAKDIHTLIEEHTKEVVAAFGGGKVRSSEASIVADQDGHVWIGDEGKLEVLAEGGWVTVIRADDTKRMGRMMLVEGAVAVIRVGQEELKWAGFTASVKAGKPVLEAWPKPLRFVPNTAQDVLAFRHGDVPRDFVGRLKFNDGVGQVWAEEGEGDATLFHAGKTVGQLKVSGLGDYWRGTTDGAGNVFLLTALGLERWGYDKALPGAAYTRRGIFALTSSPKEMLSVQYSSLGYVVIWGMTEKPPGFTGGMYRHDVVLVKVSDMKQAAETQPAKGEVKP
jgi:hypothetical protein